VLPRGGNQGGCAAPLRTRSRGSPWHRLTHDLGAPALGRRVGPVVNGDSGGWRIGWLREPPGMEARVVTELFPKAAFLGTQLVGHEQIDHDVEVSGWGVGPSREAASAQSELMAVLGSRGYSECHGGGEGWHGDVGAEHRFPGGEVEFVVEVGSLDLEIRVGFDTHAQVEIAGGGAARGFAAFAGHPDALTFVDARGDANLEGIRLRLVAPGIAPLEGYRADGSIEDFVQGHEDIAFDVGCALGWMFLG